MMSVTVSSSISGSSGPEPEHVGDQRLDEFALLGEIELDLGLGQQLLDPAGQLRLEGRRAASPPRRRRPCARARAAGSAPSPPRPPSDGIAAHRRHRAGLGSRRALINAVIRSRRTIGSASIPLRTKWAWTAASTTLASSPRLRMLMRSGLSSAVSRASSSSRARRKRSSSEIPGGETASAMAREPPRLTSGIDEGRCSAPPRQ